MMEERLLSIIAAQFAGEILPEADRVLLEEWLERLPENRREYGRLEQWYQSNAGFRVRKGINCEVAWESILEKKRVADGLRRRRLFRRMAGVAAVLALLVGTGVWMREQRGEEQFYSLKVQEVQLELGDGEKIALPSGMKDLPLAVSGVNAVCDSNRLTYRAGISPAKDETVVYNRLIVPVGAEYRLVLSDGTRVFMNAASELRYPAVFPQGKREVYLKGEAYFEVSRDTSSRFTVKTADMDIEVLGTSFNVNAYTEGSSTMATLISGKVRAVCGGREYDLQPGYQISSDRETGEVNVKEVNTLLYTAWKDGYYYFEAQHLEDIMQMVSRWYGFRVVFQEPKLKELEFSGRLQRYEEVGRLFRKFEQVENIRFIRTGDSVVVCE